MRKGELLAVAVGVCGLYLRGVPGGVVLNRKSWPRVVDALRTRGCSLDLVGEALFDAGLFEAAQCLADSRVLDWAEDVVCSGQVVTVMDECYPAGWREALGASAPPCFWVRGEMPLAPGVAVVGSRVLNSANREFASFAGAEVMSMGRSLVSGGAKGADTMAAIGAVNAGDAGRVVEILPCGLERSSCDRGVCQISLCEPWAGFSRGQAMERNALIYSYGRRAVVVRAALNRGGTWHGAVDCLRRGLGEVIVRSSCPVEGHDSASGALVGLGAIGVGSQSDLREVLGRPLVVAQPRLFGVNSVREFCLSYCA